MVEHEEANKLVITIVAASTKNHRKKTYCDIVEGLQYMI